MAKRTTMAAQLEALRAGEMTFEAFERSTRPHWARMAKYLLGRWAVPAGVEPADVEQELKMATWKYLPRWDSAKGTPLDKYIAWNAMTDAKKWMHKQARRRDDGAPARIDLPSSWLGRDDETPPESSVDATQGEDLVVAQQLAEIIEGLDEVDGHCVMTLLSTHGDVDHASEVVYGNARISLALRLGSPKDARRLVRRAVERAAALVE